jgi:hypothetical protein
MHGATHIKKKIFCMFKRIDKLKTDREKIFLRKGKVHPVTCYEVTEGKKKYGSIFY